jgi:hypothetical protein
MDSNPRNARADASRRRAAHCAAVRLRGPPNSLQDTNTFDEQLAVAS